MYWDPPRFVFTVPIINRPIAWYGIFFVTGIIIGFFILMPIFKRKLKQVSTFSYRDITNWSIFISNIKSIIGDKKHALHSIFEKTLSKNSRQKILNIKCLQEPDHDLKNEIITALNELLRFDFKRKDLEKFFPKSLKNISEQSLFLTDKITWFVIIGAIVGARLGHVFFYEWPRYSENLFDIIKVWEGGLASHGAAIGIVIALTGYRFSIRKSYPEFTILFLLDSLAIPVLVAGIFIRIGNFFNQEIVGPVTNLPWAVIFAHPVESRLILPRHPTQLYEAIAYFVISLFLYRLWWKKSDKLQTGTMIGLFFILCFGSRFFLEFFKNPNSLMFDESYLLTGQILSIPFILIGFFLLFAKRKKIKVLM